jgi:hypothetical protein
MTNRDRKNKGYRSYLLRLWQTESEGKTVWRASLESPITKRRQGFASLQDLFSFLQAQAAHMEEEQTKTNEPADFQ